MWRYAGVLLLVVAGMVSAGEVLLIPQNNPGPAYPPGLQRAGITGDVRVRFTVSADGSVSQISILESDHHDLAEAARTAIAQWRFKPWTVEGDKPAEQEIIAPMVFRLDAPNGTNQWLRQLRCRQANEHFSSFPESAWVDAAPFHYTRGYLSTTFIKTQLSNEQRLALIARLNERVPIIVRRCRDSPSIRFMSLLPEEIKKWL